MSDGNQPPANLKVVGTRPIRPDGVDKVTGRAQFGADFHLPGMLTGRIKRSPHAHARIVKIDVSAAEKLPGVKAIVTGADLEVGAGGDIEAGEHAAAMKDVAANVLASGKVLYQGHAVAAVAATSPEIAAEALDLIEVTYEVLPHVVDVDEAMAPGAPVLRPQPPTPGTASPLKPPPPTRPPGGR